MRKDYLDIAKGIGILLVVLGHSLEIYLGDGSNGTSSTAFGEQLFIALKFIYSFHMPLFFVLAGVAMTRLAGARFDKTLSGALYLILIATILQVLFAPLRLALPLPGEALPTSLAGALRYAFWPAVKLESYALVVIWFLPCLALVRLSLWLVANLPRPVGALVLGALGLLCIAEHHFGIGYFQLRSVIVGVALAAIGQHLGRLDLDRLPRAACWAGLAAALLLTALTFDVNHGCTFSRTDICPGPRYGQFAVLMVSGAFGFLPLFALTALAGTTAILCASLLLETAPWMRWLAAIGRRTLELLIVNGVTLVFVQPALAPHVADLPPPLVIVPLVLVQVAVASALHPLLHGFLAVARDTAARLAAVPMLPPLPFSRTPR